MMRIGHMSRGMHVGSVTTLSGTGRLVRPDLNPDADPEGYVFRARRVHRRTDVDDPEDLMGRARSRRRAGARVAASVYVVGGAAMALAYGRDGATPYIDALASHRPVAAPRR